MRGRSPGDVQLTKSENIIFNVFGPILQRCNTVCERACMCACVCVSAYMYVRKHMVQQITWKIAKLQ